MHVRFLLAASPSDLFAASRLATATRDSVPQVGDPQTVGDAAYRVVKVLPDVDPERGSTQRGAVAYVVRVDGESSAAPLARNRGQMPLSAMVDTAKALRECMARADLARRNGSSEEYRRHVEEFLFLSNSVARLIGPRSTAPLPYIPVFTESTGVATLLRECLIESSYAAHVEPVPSLASLERVLARLDPARPTLFIISEPISLTRGGLAARAIRAHPHGSACPILVLAQQMRASDAELASMVGANAYVGFPDGIEQFSALALRIDQLIRSTMESQGSQVG